MKLSLFISFLIILTTFSCERNTSFRHVNYGNVHVSFLSPNTEVLNSYAGLQNQLGWGSQSQIVSIRIPIANSTKSLKFNASNSHLEISWFNQKILLNTNIRIRETISSKNYLFWDFKISTNSTQMTLITLGLINFPIQENAKFKHSPEWEFFQNIVISNETVSLYDYNESIQSLEFE